MPKYSDIVSSEAQEISSLKVRHAGTQMLDDSLIPGRSCKAEV